MIPTKEDNGKEALQQAVTEAVADSGESGNSDETGASAVKVEQDSSSESEFAILMNYISIKKELLC